MIDLTKIDLDMFLTSSYFTKGYLLNNLDIFTKGILLDAEKYSMSFFYQLEKDIDIIFYNDEEKKNYIENSAIGLEVSSIVSDVKNTIHHYIKDDIASISTCAYPNPPKKKNIPQKGVKLPKTYHKDSKENTPLYFCDTKNFIDVNNIHPKLGDIIGVNNVVFKKEDLTTDKWLFLIDNEEIIEKSKKWIRSSKPYSMGIVLQDLKERQEQDYKKNIRVNIHHDYLGLIHEIHRQCSPVYIDINEFKDSPCIRRKYKKLESFSVDFLNGNYRDLYQCEIEGHFKEDRRKGFLRIPLIIQQNYQDGDEIWVISNMPNDPHPRYCHVMENILLIRNNKIICSPRTLFIIYD